MEVKEFRIMIRAKVYDAVNVCIEGDNKTLVDYNGTLVELDSFDNEEGLGVFLSPETKDVWID